MSEAVRAPVERIEALLRSGDVEVLGLMPDASNYTFAVTVSDRELRAIAVYKPQQGETPLWDFPDGTLYAREVAAYEVSAALGWELVPPTVARDGPHGLGSMQLFIDADLEQHYMTLMPEHADVFRRVAAFDLVVNNADRKAGHCLLEQETGHVWVVDHGVCFHEEPKLRTVIWDFVDEPLGDDVAVGLERLVGCLGPGEALRARLASLLAEGEVEATRARAHALLAAGRFPAPPPNRRSYPWPMI